MFTLINNNHILLMKAVNIKNKILEEYNLPKWDILKVEYHRELFNKFKNIVTSIYKTSTSNNFNKMKYLL